MANFELKLPKMGESVAEATITSWLKEVGDTIEMDEPILEIATDKVDSEVPSEVDGVLVEVLFNADDVVAVGQTIAIIATEGSAASTVPDAVSEAAKAKPVAVAEVEKTIAQAKTVVSTQDFSTTTKFYSPLVKNIAKEEGVSIAELESIQGSGKDGRVNKNDILSFIATSKNGNTAAAPEIKTASPSAKEVKPATKAKGVSSLPLNEGDEVVAMDRMRKLISHHMVASVQTSAHVQSFVECDVTNIWNWRKKVKDAFQKREGEKLTFTPIFMTAVAHALKNYPGMNVAVDGENIIKRKRINLGMAAALPDGNLIVPVIKDADQLNLVGMAKAVNALANKARSGKLSPDDIQGGTYTVTNVGNFGSIMGTPIINQPQVGILALGAIRKTPAVIETPDGDFIGIRMKMYLSHSYDHRVVDGALGGMFAKTVADYLEAWDVNSDF
jgi:2-oxoglutarate dehydrogenase E2 component (dihydrolipoamide succinyltransferase)